MNSQSTIADSRAGSAGRQPAEKQLGLFDRPKAMVTAVAADDPNVAFVVEQLGRQENWITAAALLPVIGKAVTESNKRWLRAIADASGGRIAGGQHGYKLIAKMTSEEFQHWRNWMIKQSTEMQRRVVEADKVFYGRQAVQI